MRVGPIGILAAPHYATCSRCRTPFKFVKPHTVWVSFAQGYFTLCTKCWDAVTPERRVYFHRKPWRTLWAADVPWGQLAQAILVDPEPSWYDHMGNLLRRCSAEDFARGYAERSGMSLDELLEHMTVRPCDFCGYDRCEGWKMVSLREAEEIDDPSKPWAR